MIDLPIRFGAFLLLVVLGAAQYYHVTVSGKKRSVSLDQMKALGKRTAKTPAQLENEKTEMAAIKEFYYKLQHLEEYPDSLPGAWKLLRSMLDRSSLLGRYKATANRSILEIGKFDALRLQEFLDAELADTMTEWETYVRRRQAGGPKEKFPDIKDAHTWLKNLAPLNYIDGAWVSRVHKVTTPYALRRVTKDAWQTYSEEMGDGDLDKNHVHLYRRLMKEIGAGLPAADHPDFTHERHGIDDISYREATAHLLISLFPNDFLPEILGFNLHFETPSLGSLQAMKELGEHNIDPEYFVLHISIDNADSGHSAMAMATVIRFMNIVEKTGFMDYDEAWRRIQNGYLLSQNCGSEITVESFESQVASMLQRKAGLARKIHCTSRARIGGRSLSDWFTADWRGLEPAKDGVDWKQQFLTALADAKPWVYRGNSQKSLLMKELAWKGRMFGAFTENEVELMRTWIDSLKTGDGGYGEAEPNLNPFSQDAATFHPAFPPQQPVPDPVKYGTVLTPRQPLQSSKVRLDVLLPLWFTHPCLLENMTNSPHQMANRLESHLLQIIRIDSAYKPDAHGVAGMDEHMYVASPDLIALGLSICRKYELPEPTSLGDVLGSDDGAREQPDAVAFAYNLLSWAMRPKGNAMFLIGLARAFLDFEVFVASRDDLLPRKERTILQSMADRKMVCFEDCLHELKSESEKLRAVVSGYEFGRNELEQLMA
ncbi:hypothetical protein P153DRAFT_371620 [Dothidotthia symphoricarpi CBS 119687]|uniref:Heme oxygenase-like protein n=1 Tax=Dothidotthia symphoricarpi CBS 119687 TaxID=1392245 RepID=A0A6A5ZXB9_9PLEO|nr:uncharacterized protein P153DRAFT_371620 [Dothidotthia symphoricarpi CBS 119687]KAF2123417.1 hypothetical protein P153DRAFT_371620 [Dothidotthia symphoricarpi CBS 119687]